MAEQQKWVKLDEFKRFYAQGRKKELSFSERVRDFFDIMVSVPGLVKVALTPPKSAATNPVLVSSAWKDANDTIYCTAAASREIAVNGWMKAIFGGFAKRNTPIFDRALAQCTDYSAKVESQRYSG